MWTDPTTGEGTLGTGSSPYPCRYVVPDVLPRSLKAVTPPVLGEIDDLTVILFAVAGFLRLCPSLAVAFHRAAIEDGRRYAPMLATDDIIHAEWRRD